MAGAFWAIVSIVAGIFISHIYYRLSNSKSLGFFLLVDEQPLSRVDPQVRARMVFQFMAPEQPSVEPDEEGPSLERSKNFTMVQSMHHVQIVLANTGVRPITFGDPPSFEIAGACPILDAAVLYRKPPDMRADVALSPIDTRGIQTIRMAIPILNRGEFILVKILLGDVISRDNLQLNVQAEDLPRTIPIVPIPADATKSRLESIDWSAAVVGMVFGLGAACGMAVSSMFFSEHPLPPSSINSWREYLAGYTWMHVTSAISWLFSLIVGLLGGAFLYGFVLRPSMKRRRFVLPPELRPGPLAK